jgi:hypothetical protein
MEYRQYLKVEFLVVGTLVSLLAGCSTDLSFQRLPAQDRLASGTVQQGGGNGPGTNPTPPPVPGPTDSPVPPVPDPFPSASPIPNPFPSASPVVEFFPIATRSESTVAVKVYKPIDILWVIDNSFSMDPDQANLAAAFSNFANVYLRNTNIDLRMLAITTDTYMAGKTGGYGFNYLYPNNFENPIFHDGVEIGRAHV